MSEPASHQLTESEKLDGWASHPACFLAPFTFPLQPSIVFGESADRIWIEHRRRPTILTLVCCWLMPLACGAILRYLAPSMLTSPKALQLLHTVRDWVMPASVALAMALTLGAILQQSYFRRKGAIVEMRRASGLICGRQLREDLRRSDLLACRVAIGYTTRKAWTEAQFLVAVAGDPEPRSPIERSSQVILAGAWNGSGAEVTDAFQRFAEEIGVDFRVDQVNSRWSMDRLT